MKKLITLILLLPLYIQAQDCNCNESFTWLKKTFEANDAGFPIIIKNKGTDTYRVFSDSIAQLAMQIHDHKECVELLDEWSHFFRKGHVGVYYSYNASKNAKAQKAKVSKKEPETWSIDTASLFKQWINRDLRASLTGVWVDSNYKMAIVPDTINPERDYVGVLLWTNKSQWEVGEIKAEFYNTDSGSIVNYYMADRSLRQRSFDFDLCRLKMGTIWWNRSSKYMTPKYREEFAVYSTDEPLFKQINQKTVLLRIPSFNYKYKEKIDNLLKEHHDLLNATQNLIVDLRGNGGGSDASFRKIIPYLYTHPIKLHSIEIRSTPLNIEAYKNWFKRSFWRRVIFAFYIKKRLKKNIGGYVSLTETKIKRIDDYEPKPHPENVYVIADEDCASSTEQFLLNAEQSKKTTIVGKTTLGAIDVSNINTVTFPNNKYKLSYATSRSLRLPKRKIDDIGIAPDIFIPDSIPKYRWLRYIENNLLDSKSEL